MSWGDRAAEQHEQDQPSEWERRPTFALDADVTIYWPDVRPCWEDQPRSLEHCCPHGKRTDNYPGPHHEYDCDLWDPR